MNKKFIGILICFLLSGMIFSFSLSQGLLKAGNKYFSEKNYIGAKNIYSTITILEPENNDVRKKLIKVFLELKENKKALREVYMVLSYSPNDKDMEKLKNELEIIVKKEANPVSKIKPKIKKFKVPKFVQLTNLLKLKAKKTHLGISSKNKKNFDLGYSYYKKQDYKKALSFFEKVLRSPLDKSNYSLCQFAGECYFWTGNYKKAIELLDKVVSHEKKNIEGRILLGYSYMSLLKPEYKKAYKLFSEVLKIKKDYIPALIGSGLCRLKTGKLKEAEVIFNKVVKLSPTELKGYFGLSEIYLKRKLYEKSMEYLYQALVYSPNSYETIEKIGDLYIKMKNYKTAAYIYRKALDFAPTSGELYGKLCIALLYGKENFTAGLYLGKALKLDPENEVINMAYGMFWEANIEFEKAVHSYKKALSVDPRLIDARFFLINLLMGNSNVFPNAAKIYSNKIAEITSIYEAESQIQEMKALDKKNIYSDKIKEFEDIIFNKKADIEERQRAYQENYKIEIKKP